MEAIVYKVDTDEMAGRFTKVDNPRNKFMKFYVNKDEEEHIKNQISCSGLSTSEYCRYHLLGKKVVSKVDAKFFHELSSLGGKINKLGGLQKELFNNSPKGKEYAGETSQVIVDIRSTLVEITLLAKEMKENRKNT